MKYGDQDVAREKMRPRTDPSMWQNGSTWQTSYKGVCPEGRCIKREGHTGRCWPN
jgi:hypothetical protein